MVDNIYTVVYDTDNNKGTFIIGEYDGGEWDFPMYSNSTTWRCIWCGKLNQEAQLSCGSGEWDGCGAVREG